MENEFLQDLLEAVVKVAQRLDRLEEKIDRFLRVKDCLNGETLLDNGDMCQLLGITKKTLQRYRQLKLIKYYPMEGKIIYKSSEVLEFINSFEVGVARKKFSPLYQESKNKK